MLLKLTEQKTQQENVLPKLKGQKMNEQGNALPNPRK